MPPDTPLLVDAAKVDMSFLQGAGIALIVIVLLGALGLLWQLYGSFREMHTILSHPEFGVVAQLKELAAGYRDLHTRVAKLETARR